MWLQCEPCDPCYPQNQEVYDPSSSIYVIEERYGEPACNLVKEYVDSVPDQDGFCVYHILYEDGVSSTGYINSDKLTLHSINGEDLVFDPFIYGCGHQNIGDLFDNPYSSGIIGLGQGSASLIGQIYNHIQGKFAHCLVPRTSAERSKLLFGQHAIISGPDVVSTRLKSRAHSEEFYFVTLAAISFGGEQINIDPGNFNYASIYLFCVWVM